MSFEQLHEPRSHRDGMRRDIAQGRDRWRLAEPPGFARRVLDRLVLGPDELAEQLLQQPPALALSRHTRPECSQHAAHYGAFRPRCAADGVALPPDVRGRHGDAQQARTAQPMLPFTV